MMNRTLYQRFFIPIIQGILVIGVFLCSTAFVWSQTGQVFQGRKVYSNNAAFGEIVVNFCDSSVSGKFIGSPRYLPCNVFGMSVPEFDGRFMGRLQNGKWVGNWFDSSYTGKFVVRFSNNFNHFEGKFTRSNNQQEWIVFEGDEKEESSTVEGRRSVALAGIASYFLPGMGQHYNREYGKSAVHNIIWAVGGTAAMSGFGILTALAIVSVTPLGQAPPSSNDRQNLFNTGLILLLGGAAISGTMSIVSTIDAVISADRINADMNTQPPYQCLSAPSVGEPRFGLEVGIANAAFMPQPSINLALHVPLY